MPLLLEAHFEKVVQLHLVITGILVVQFLKRSLQKGSEIEMDWAFSSIPLSFKQQNLSISSAFYKAQGSS